AAPPPAAGGWPAARAARAGRPAGSSHLAEGGRWRGATAAHAGPTPRTRPATSRSGRGRRGARRDPVELVEVQDDVAADPELLDRDAHRAVGAAEALGEDLPVLGCLAQPAEDLIHPLVDPPEEAGVARQLGDTA